MIARLIDFYCVVLPLFITGVRPQAAIAEQSSERGIVSILLIITAMVTLSYFGFHYLMSEKQTLPCCRQRLLDERAQFVAFSL